MVRQRVRGGFAGISAGAIGFSEVGFMQNLIGIFHISLVVVEAGFDGDVGLQTFGKNGAVAEFNQGTGDAKFIAVAEREILEETGLARRLAANEQSFMGPHATPPPAPRQRRKFQY